MVHEPDLQFPEVLVGMLIALGGKIIWDWLKNRNHQTCETIPQECRETMQHIVEEINSVKSSQTKLEDTIAKTAENTSRSNIYLEQLLDVQREQNRVLLDIIRTRQD